MVIESVIGTQQKEEFKAHAITVYWQKNWWGNRLNRLYLDGNQVGLPPGAILDAMEEPREIQAIFFSV